MTNTIISTSPPSSSANQQNSSSAAGVTLESFLLLSKSARGAAATNLIMQAINAPNVYVFGELLRAPNLRELADSAETRPYWNLLQLFAYGTYGDYVGAAGRKQINGDLPPFTESMVLKLRQLTIVSLAAAAKNIPYPQLLRELAVRNVRELEDLIIDAIYNGVIVGKLDQRNQQLEVDRCMGRDVRAEEIPSIVSTLGDWCDRCDFLFSITDQQMNKANMAKLAAAEDKKKVHAEFNNAKKALKAGAAAGASAGHGPDMDDFMGDVSSTAAEPTTADGQKKKEKGGPRKGGLRGSAGNKSSWLKN